MWEFQWVLVVGGRTGKSNGAVVGRSRGRKADFSTALLTQNVSSFGRNDDFPGVKEKRRRVKVWFKQATAKTTAFVAG
jgi:hypothetical protein